MYNILSLSSTGLHSDCKDRRVLPSKQLAEVTAHRDAWLSLNSCGSDIKHEVKLSEDISELIVPKSLPVKVNTRPSTQLLGNTTATASDSDYLCGSESSSNSVLIFASLNSALSWLGRGLDSNLDDFANSDSLPYISQSEHIQVFIAGSLYLVGNSFLCLNEEVK